MKLLRWLLLMSAACTGGSSSSGSGADDGPQFIVVEGLSADGKFNVCLDGERFLTDSFVVRNVSGMLIEVDAGSAIPGELAISKSLLDVGETATVTVGAGGIASPVPYVDHIAGVSATPHVAAVIQADGTLARPRLQNVPLTIHFDVDDRAYTLVAETSRAVGHQVGSVKWTTSGRAVLPPPPISADGPFLADGQELGNEHFGRFRFHIAEGAAGEEVKGTLRVTPLRCSQKTLPESPPVSVTGLRSNVATKVATGLVHTCALDTQRRAFCWGDDAYGQLGLPIGTLEGNGSVEPRLVATLGAGLDAIVAGRAHTCALRAGDVLCWGDSSLGQCGPDVAGMTAQPTKIALGMPALAVVARGDRSCASVADGRVICWGRDASGTGQIPPTALPSTTGAVQIALGDAHVCIRSSVGSVLCSGVGGRIGDGTTTASDVPMQILTGVTDIAAGATHTCAVLKSGTLLCWGDMPDSGGSTTVPLLTPQEVPWLFPAALLLHVAAAGHTTCTMGTTIKCTDSSEFQAVNVTTFDTGGAHVCAVYDGGKIVCAGDNARGQSGLGDEGNGIFGFDGP